jgi:hypothetical protein
MQNLCEKNWQCFNLFHGFDVGNILYANDNIIIIGKLWKILLKVVKNYNYYFFEKIYNNTTIITKKNIYINIIYKIW